MVSFRHSQLQAILVGLVIADALSLGQFPWPLGSYPEAGSAPMRQSAGAIADARWCHAIARQCQTETPDDQSPSPPLVASLPPAPPDPPTAEPPGLTPLLMQLPRVLTQLDTPLLVADAGTTALHTALTACLSQDSRTLRALQHQSGAGADGETTDIHDGISRAIATVLAAQGDFQLAIGQSLYESPAIVGLPVLTGILSAGWGDLSSVPCRYRHWLNQPSPKLQSWLQQRWQMSNGTMLEDWAIALWRRWLGMDMGANGSTPIAVIPITAALPPSRSP